MTGGEVESKQRSPERAFQDDGSYLERFLSKLKTANLAPPFGHKTTEAVVDTIIAIVLEDQRKLLASISKGLDEIELSMGTDMSSPQSWRDYPPRWRNHLFHQSETIAYYLSGVPECSAASPSSARTPTRDEILKRAEKQVEASMRLLEGTYQVLMSFMSILESERAIDQALSSRQRTPFPTGRTGTAFFTSERSQPTTRSCWRAILRPTGSTRGAHQPLLGISDRTHSSKSTPGLKV
jgi:hypothetical protein